MKAGRGEMLFRGGSALVFAPPAFAGREAVFEGKFRKVGRPRGCRRIGLRGLGGRCRSGSVQYGQWNSNGARGKQSRTFESIRFGSKRRQQCSVTILVLRFRTRIIHILNSVLSLSAWPYELVAPLGAGGMGEVYRALDLVLNREVAIKVLPAALASDGDYLARFQREAQALEALNHPNIAAIYGLEGKAIVMELVEGEMLRGPLPLAEAMGIARQIAETLEAAHEKGIIHRDLKPGYVVVTASGVVKVLACGLAKGVERSPVSGANSPTLTMRATEEGLILGTAGYMSPEQAAGKAVDRRADIWSFGVVLALSLHFPAGRRIYTDPYRCFIVVPNKGRAPCP